METSANISLGRDCSVRESFAPDQMHRFSCQFTSAVGITDNDDQSHLTSARFNGSSSDLPSNDIVPPRRNGSANAFPITLQDESSGGKCNFNSNVNTQRTNRSNQTIGEQFSNTVVKDRTLDDYAEEENPNHCVAQILQPQHHNGSFFAMPYKTFAQNLSQSQPAASNKPNTRLIQSTDMNGGCSQLIQRSSSEECQQQQNMVVKPRRRRVSEYDDHDKENVNPFFMSLQQKQTNTAAAAAIPKASGPANSAMLASRTPTNAVRQQKNKIQPLQQHQPQQSQQQLQQTQQGAYQPCVDLSLDTSNIAHAGGDISDASLIGMPFFKQETKQNLNDVSSHSSSAMQQMQSQQQQLLQQQQEFDLFGHQQQQQQIPTTILKHNPKPQRLNKKSLSYDESWSKDDYGDENYASNKNTKLPEVSPHSAAQRQSTEQSACRRRSQFNVSSQKQYDEIYEILLAERRTSNELQCNLQKRSHMAEQYFWMIEMLKSKLEQKEIQLKAEQQQHNEEIDRIQSAHAEQLSQMESLKHLNKIDATQYEKTLEISNILMAENEKLIAQNGILRKQNADLAADLSSLAERSTNQHEQLLLRIKLLEKQQQQHQQQQNIENNNKSSLGRIRSSTHDHLPPPPLPPTLTSDCIQQLLKLMSVKSEAEVLKKVQSLQEERASTKQFIECIQGMVVKCAPSDCFEAGSIPTLKQSWKFLKSVMQKYIALKLHASADTNLIEKLFDILHVRSPEGILAAITALTSKPTPNKPVITGIDESVLSHFDSSMLNYSNSNNYQSIKAPYNHYRKNPSASTTPKTNQSFSPSPFVAGAKSRVLSTNGDSHSTEGRKSTATASTSPSIAQSSQQQLYRRTAAAAATGTTITTTWNPTVTAFGHVLM